MNRCHKSAVSGHGRCILDPDHLGECQYEHADANEASPEEMRTMLHTPGAMRTLATCLAYCRRMEAEHPERAQAWRGQAWRFQLANPTRPKSKAPPRRRRKSPVEKFAAEMQAFNRAPFR